MGGFEPKELIQKFIIPLHTKSCYLNAQQSDYIRPVRFIDEKDLYEKQAQLLESQIANDKDEANQLSCSAKVYRARYLGRRHMFKNSSTNSQDDICDSLRSAAEGEDFGELLITHLKHNDQNSVYFWGFIVAVTSKSFHKLSAMLDKIGHSSSAFKFITNTKGRLNKLNEVYLLDTMAAFWSSFTKFAGLALLAEKSGIIRGSSLAELHAKHLQHIFLNKKDRKKLKNAGGKGIGKNICKDIEQSSLIEETLEIFSSIVSINDFSWNELIKLKEAIYFERPTSPTGIKPSHKGVKSGEKKPPDDDDDD